MLRHAAGETKGFTLVELLAVMAIIAVLAGVVSVAVSGASQTSRDTQVKQDASTQGKNEEKGWRKVNSRVARRAILCR